MTRNPYNKSKVKVAGPSVANVTKEKESGKNKNTAAAKTLLPRHIDKAAKDVIGITKELVKFLKEENKALENADVSHFLALQDSKIEVTQKYNEAMQSLLSRKDELKTLPPERKEQLGTIHKTFTVVKEENLSAIERMRNSMERLNGHIMHSARSHADKKGVNYSGRGQIQKESRSLSMGINESA